MLGTELCGTNGRWGEVEVELTQQCRLINETFDKCRFDYFEVWLETGHVDRKLGLLECNPKIISCSKLT